MPNLARARSRKAQPFRAFSKYNAAASGNCFLNVGEDAHWASAAVAAAATYGLPARLGVVSLPLGADPLLGDWLNTRYENGALV